MAHINANSTGEVRTFLLVLKNQEQRDTITVTQGSIDDFVGKTYSLYGYDLLKMTSSTTDINSLVTQFVGTFEKVSDTKLSFVSDDTGMKMLFYFDPANLSLTLKGVNLSFHKRRIIRHIAIVQLFGILNTMLY